MKQEHLIKAASFCAYQERTQREVRERLMAWGIDEEEAEEIIVELIAQNYLNEERFARTYAGGKFRLKHWGRLKIKYELKMRGLSEYNIKAGLSEIEEEAYREMLENLLQKKWLELRRDEPLVRKQKVVRYAVGKGFEQGLVWEMMAKVEGFNE